MVPSLPLLPCESSVSVKKKLIHGALRDLAAFVQFRKMKNSHEGVLIFSLQLY